MKGKSGKVILRYVECRAGLSVSENWNLKGHQDHFFPSYIFYWFAVGGQQYMFGLVYGNVLIGRLKLKYFLDDMMRSVV